MLSNLKGLFDMSVHLCHMSRSDEVQLCFLDLFRHMKATLDEILPEEESARQRQQQELLEKYSDLLVGLVQKKMQPQ